MAMSGKDAFKREEKVNTLKSPKGCEPTDEPETVDDHEPNFPPNWPKEVKCEMNISAWETALEKAKLLPDYADVIRGFREGFDQGIPHHNILDPTTSTPMKFFTPPNHSSAVLAAEKIKQSIDEEVKAGRLRGPYTRDQLSEVFPFFRTSPMGAVINNDGSLRPINDLSYPKRREGVPSVNSFVDAKRFTTTWDDFKTVASFFTSSKDQWLLAIFDWEKAYRQIPTSPSQWAYLLVLDLEDNIYLDTRITFGGVAGCGSFGRPADAWKHIMIAEFDLMTIFRWVDDNLFVKRLMSATNMDNVVARSQELGVLTNKKKCSNFSHEQKFIGFIWNGVEKTVRLPQEKLSQRKLQIEEFLKGGPFSFDQVEVLTGRLTHVSYILPQLKCYLNSLHRWKKSWIHKFAKQHLPLDAREDLEYWKKSLDSFRNHRLIPSLQPKDIKWVGDASTSFGIGVLIGSKWSQFKLKTGWELRGNVKRGIAWLETVAIRIGLLMLIEMRWPKGQNLTVWTDNTTCENTLRKRKSRDTSVNEEWKCIQHLLITHQLDLTPVRVTSKDNIADKLSRGEATDHREGDRVHINLPPDLDEALEATRIS